MGEIVATGNGEIDGNNLNEQTRGDRTSGKSSSTTSSTTETRTSGSGGTGGRTRGETNEEKIVSELALLTEEEKQQYKVADEQEQKRILRNAKRRERYAKQKADGGQPVKPRKVRQAKTPAQQPVDTKQLNAIIISLSAVVASRPNCEHWLLNEKEVESITTPLSKMLAESQALETIGQYSNQIALVMACVTVFAPRLFVTVQKQKEEKKRAITGQTTNTNVKDERRDTSKSTTGNKKIDSRNGGNTTSNGTNNSTNEHFYGVPIC